MTTTLSLYKERQEAGEPLDIFDPDDCTEFFRRFYGLNALDSKSIQRERASLNFANVGKAFQMIESNWSFPVVVPWPMSGENAGEGMRRAEAFRAGPSRATNRALQPYIVQISKQAAQELKREGIIEFYEDSIGLPYSSFTDQWYDEEFGIVKGDDDRSAYI
jgi:CRISPR-associated endonuclease/helicase Cas3